jgi:hypothetical protein
VTWLQVTPAPEDFVVQNTSGDPWLDAAGLAGLSPGLVPNALGPLLPPQEIVDRLGEFFSDLTLENIVILSALGALLCALIASFVWFARRPTHAEKLRQQEMEKDQHYQQFMDQATASSSTVASTGRTDTSTDASFPPHSPFLSVRFRSMSESDEEEPGDDTSTVWTRNTASSRRSSDKLVDAM